MSGRIPFTLGPDGNWHIPNQQTEFDRMFAKAEGAIKETVTFIRPILQAGGAAKPHDMEALRHTVFTQMMQKLDRFHRDEMHMLLTTLLADRIMEDVDRDRWGSGTPDKMS